MDFLLEALTNWLKEMLVGGIMSNLSGMFDSVNQQVADISVHRPLQKRLSRLSPRIFGRRLPRATPSTMRGCPLRMYAMGHENR